MSSKAITFLTNKRAYSRPEPLNLLSAKGCKVKYVTSPGFRGNKWSHYLRYNKKWPFVHFSKIFCVLKQIVVPDHTQPWAAMRLPFNIIIVWTLIARNSSGLHLQKFFIFIYGHYSFYWDTRITHDKILNLIRYWNSSVFNHWYLFNTYVMWQYYRVAHMNIIIWNNIELNGSTNEIVVNIWILLLAKV